MKILDKAHFYNMIVAFERDTKQKVDYEDVVLRSWELTHHKSVKSGKHYNMKNVVIATFGAHPSDEQIVEAVGQKRNYSIAVKMLPCMVLTDMQVKAITDYVTKRNARYYIRLIAGLDDTFYKDLLRNYDTRNL